MLPVASDLAGTPPGELVCRCPQTRRFAERSVTERKSQTAAAAAPPRGMALCVRMKGAQKWRAGSGTSAPEEKAPGDTEPMSGAAAARPELPAAPKPAEMAGPREAGETKAKEVRISGEAQGDNGKD